MQHMQRCKPSDTSEQDAYGSRWMHFMCWTEYCDCVADGSTSMYSNVRCAPCGPAKGSRASFHLFQLFHLAMGRHLQNDPSFADRISSDFILSFSHRSIVPSFRRSVISCGFLTGPAPTEMLPMKLGHDWSSIRTSFSCFGLDTPTCPPPKRK